MMRRQARSSTRITGRRELHDLGSPCLSRSQNPVELTDCYESGVKRLRRSAGCPPNDEPGLWQALDVVTDPRYARGLRYRLPLLLALAVLAVAAGA